MTFLEISDGVSGVTDQGLFMALITAPSAALAESACPALGKFLGCPAKGKTPRTQVAGNVHTTCIPEYTFVMYL